MIYFDRSRRASFEHCPRDRYYGYEINGRGIQLVRVGRSEWPLMTGTGIHSGIENLLLEACDVPSLVDWAVGKAIKNSGYLDLSPADDDRETFLRNEQIALIEAIVRCWAVVYLPTFVEMYELLGIEREETLALTPDVTMMVRPDMLVRRKADGALFTWQLKSTKRCDERWVGQWAIDQMTLSEPLAIEERLRTEAACAIPDSEQAGGLVGFKLSGVIIQGLLKGEQRQYPAGSGQWYHDSPLIWGWKNESGKPHPRGQWSARYEWADDSGSHRLGKGWRKVPIWESYTGGVKAWITYLAENDAALLHEQIVTLPPILRNDFEASRWRASVIHSERHIRLHREDVQLNALSLDQAFPMHTSGGNCLWPYRCRWYAICHEGADPDDTQLFEPRECNHSTEKLGVTNEVR